MTNEEQKLREFAERWSLKIIECMKGDDYLVIDVEECLSDLTALISGGYYPKEFTEYIAINIERGHLWKPSEKDSWVYFDGTGSHKLFKSTDELFNYWKENEQC